MTVDAVMVPIKDRYCSQRRAVIYWQKDHMQKITPFLWFDGAAEEAAAFYTSVFRKSKMGAVSRYGEAGQEIHGQAPGSVMTVSFEIEGQQFMALNGGPHFHFTPAISFVVHCETQKEIDYYWERLSAVEEAEQCGWLQDKFGVAWQIVPTIVGELVGDNTSAQSQRVMEALLRMKKIDIDELKKAHEGGD